MDERKIIKWITVRGVHVPIYDKSNKSLKEFLSNKNNKEDKAYDKLFNAQEKFMGRKLTDNEKQKLKDATRQKAVTNIYGEKNIKKTNPIIANNIKKKNKI